MPAVSPRVTDAHRQPGAEPLRRKRVQTAPLAVVRRRTVHLLLIFVTIVLVVDALVGEKGLIEALKARQHYRDVEASLVALRRDNARLREEIRRLNDDPATIEAIARKELGLIRPGEMVFVIKDTKPAR